MLICSNPECGLTVVDIDSMYPNLVITCKVCGALLEVTNSIE